MRKHLKFIILSVFAILILWFFGRNLDWQAVSASIKKANPLYLAAAVLVVCFGYLLRAIRWKVLLEPITKSSLKELFATTTVGFAAIFFVGRAGEIVRPMWLPMRDRRVRPSAALVTLGLERIFDLASLICFFAINLIWFKPPAGREDEFAYVKMLGNILLAGAAASFVALIVFQRISKRVVEWFTKATDRKWVPGRLRAIFLSLLRQLAASLMILRDWRETLSVSFWTTALWLSIAVPTWLVLLSFGLPLTLSDSLFVMGWAALGSLVPTPGGAAGAFHAATAGGLIFLNVPKDEAAAVSIIMHLVYFAPAVFFGLFYFFHGDISFDKFRSLLSSEHAVEEIETDSPDLEPIESTPHVEPEPVPTEN